MTRRRHRGWRAGPLTSPEVLDPDLKSVWARVYSAACARCSAIAALEASYNGGEDNVRRWIAARPRLEDLWVESSTYWKREG